MAAIRIMSAEVPLEAAGPCGAAIDALTLDGGAGRTYDTDVGHIVGVVVPRDAADDAYRRSRQGRPHGGLPVARHDDRW